jgi:hypothetical protein
MVEDAGVSELLSASIIRATCHSPSLMMEAEITSETSVYFYETARRHIPEGCHHLALTTLSSF